jgi:hypothetical protein
MASTQTWSEGNGTNAGTETTGRTEANWKNIDDSTTAYSASPITAGNNSFSKYQAIKYAGTFNSLSALTYKVSSNAPGTGLSVVASVITAATPATPSATATGDAAASTTGTSANFVHTNTWASVFAAGASTGGPNDATSWYGQAYRTQLQTTGSAAPGDISTVTITATWTES